MNELLGLFGYEDKVDSTDTENLNLDNYTDNKDASSDDEDSPPNGAKVAERKPVHPKSRLRHRKYNAQ